jgi:hypothetical protein
MWLIARLGLSVHTEPTAGFNSKIRAGFEDTECNLITACAFCSRVFAFETYGNFWTFCDTNRLQTLEMKS